MYKLDLTRNWDVGHSWAMLRIIKLDVSFDKEVFRNHLWDARASQDVSSMYKVGEIQLLPVIQVKDIPRYAYTSFKKRYVGTCCHNTYSKLQYQESAQVSCFYIGTFEIPFDFSPFENVENVCGRQKQLQPGEVEAEQTESGMKMLECRKTVWCK